MSGSFSLLRSPFKYHSLVKVFPSTLSKSFVILSLGTLLDPFIALGTVTAPTSVHLLTFSLVQALLVMSTRWKGHPQVECWASPCLDCRFLAGSSHACLIHFCIPVLSTVPGTYRCSINILLLLET